MVAVRVGRSSFQSHIISCRATGRDIRTLGTGVAATGLQGREGGRVGRSATDSGRLATVHWGGLGGSGPAALGGRREVVMRRGFEIVRKEGQRGLLAGASSFGWMR